LKYLLIIFVIAIALAPLSHFAPSKRQRQIARLREYAAVHGLFTEFRSLPGSAAGRARSRDQAGHETIYYGKRLPPSKHRRGQQGCAWLREQGDWVSLGPRVPAPALLRELPAEILAASVDEGSCGVYWRESGGVELVAQITRILTLWSEELRATES
jgi:hypothetical protein